MKLLRKLQRILKFLLLPSEFPSQLIYLVCLMILCWIFVSGGSREIETYEHILRFHKTTGASSVMIARAAQYNSSVFRSTGKLSLDEVIPEYLKLCIEYDNVFTNTKYCVQMMLRDLQETPMGKRLLDSKIEEEI
jgi:tRNA-dihydrouridine synthase 2